MNFINGIDSIMDALIGCTGFVGGNLLKQNTFALQYNSRNIQNAQDRHFNMLVCAAASGSMYEANKFPDRDECQINSLISSLSGITAKQFVLISSVAVLEDFQTGEDEGTKAFQTKLAYGRNRRFLEEYCAKKFESCLIVRLPALFGTGLKKNFIFDILNPMPSMLLQPRFYEIQERLPQPLASQLSKIYIENPELNAMVIDRAVLEQSGLRASYDKEITALGMSAVQFTNPDTQFQYYDMTRLWSDIQLALRARLSVLHLAPEPLIAKDVYKTLTLEDMPATQARLHREDMRTRHAALWELEGPYIMGAADILMRLRGFFTAEKACI